MANHPRRAMTNPWTYCTRSMSRQASSLLKAGADFLAVDFFGVDFFFAGDLRGDLRAGDLERLRGVLLVLTILSTCVWGFNLC